MAIYIDENPKKGWAVKGQKCEYTTTKTIKGKRYSLILAINNKKVINYKIVERGVT